MQLAWQAHDEIDERIDGAPPEEFTPSGVVPVGWARGPESVAKTEDPVIVVRELSAVEVASLGLGDLGPLARGDDDAKPPPSQVRPRRLRPRCRRHRREPDHTFELGTAAKGDLAPDRAGWSDDEETSRFVRGVPVLLPRCFGEPELGLARRLAAELALGAAKQPSPLDGPSPWALARPASLPTGSAGQRTWRTWLFVAAVTAAVEASLLAGLAFGLH